MFEVYECSKQVLLDVLKMVTFLRLHVSSKIQLFIYLFILIEMLHHLKLKTREPMKLTFLTSSYTSFHTHAYS